MSRRKTAEQKLVEAVKELGLLKADSVFQVLKAYNQDEPVVKRRPKLVKGETAS